MATDNECPICVETLHGSPSVGCTVPCGHVFHRKCFETWQIHSPAKRCPCCNIELSCFIDKIHIHLPETPAVVQQQQEQEVPPPKEQEHEDSDEEGQKGEGPEPELKDSVPEQQPLQNEDDDKPDDKTTQNVDKERELKMKRRAALSMEKAQRAMRLRNHKAASVGTTTAKPEQRSERESCNDDKGYNNGIRDGELASCRTKMSSSMSPCCARSEYTKQAPSAYGAKDSKSREDVTSLSRTLQRPAVVKHPYRYMHGRTKSTKGSARSSSVKFSTPEVVSQNSQVFEVVLDTRNDLEEDQIQMPDLADKIMRDIERSSYRSI